MVRLSPTKMVCVFAHPDDESFGPGGSIAYYASQIPVHILCVTPGDGNGNAELGQVRRRELRASAQILGVQNVTFLDFADGSLCNNNYHEIAAQIQQYLDQHQPDSVMTFDPNGVSGHIDHVAVAMICSYLFERLTYLRYLLYFCEGDYFKDVLKEYFIYVPPGYPRSQIDLTLDVKPYLDTKIAAMHSHHSQQNDCDRILATMKDHLNEEYFRILSKDGGNA